jgi:hypothetical protein
VNDQPTLNDLRAICKRGELVAVWHPNMLDRFARLNRPALAEAKRIVRQRFGKDIAPQALAKVIRERRAGFLRSEQAKSFDVSSDRNSDQKVLGRKKAFAAQLGRLGGMRRVPKGFSTMTAEQLAEVRALALAGRKRAREQRQAARAAEEMALNGPGPAVLTQQQIGSSAPTSTPPAVTIGRGRG